MADLLETIKDFARGVVKGNTTDMADLGAMTPQAKILGFIKEKVLGEKSPEQTGDQVFEQVTGSKPTGSVAETVGTFISPEAPAAALKAMIIGAVRLPARMAAKTAAEASAAAAGTKLNAAELFSQSGVYVDLAGKLRTTLSDAGASFNLDKLKGTPGSLPLDQVLNHPKLFELYPELKNYKIYTGPGENLASFYAPEKEIFLNEKLSKSDALSAVLHEVQHGIQTIEGTIGGGNKLNFLPANPETVQRVVTKARESGDKTAIAVAERLKSKFNEQVRAAEVKYMNIPGEQEARFTQQTMNLSDKELGAVVLDLLKKNTSPQTYDTRAVPIVTKY